MRNCAVPEGKDCQGVVRLEAFAVGMWYEILPSLGVIYVCLILPGIATSYIQKVANGNKPKRIVRTTNSWLLMERDERVSKTNRYYDSKGLENID